MPRWHAMVFCLSLATVGPMGCALNSSPGEQTSTSQAFTRPAAFLTAVDVDVLDDHTLVTLQSDAPLQYSVRRDEVPPRLVVDLPAHRIAPGVRPLEVFRGGVTGIYPHQVAEPGGSQVEIGLLPGVTHSWSSPFASTLLVEIRADASVLAQPPTGEGPRPKGRGLGTPGANRSAAPPNGKTASAAARTGGGRARIRDRMNA